MTNTADESQLQAERSHKTTMHEKKAIHEKDFWDKLSISGSFFSVTAISFILGFMGHWYTYKVQDRKLDLEILKLAIDVLRSKPAESGGEDMRRWSLGVLETYSKVQFKGDSPVHNQVILTNIQGFVGNRIDVDVFVCDSNDAESLRVANAYGNLLTTKYGRIRIKPWNSKELDEKLLKGKTTIVFDAGTDEEEVAKDLEILGSQVKGLPNIQRVPNPGEPSKWYLSVIICR